MYKEGGVPDPETLRSVLAILRQTANEPAGDTVEPLTTREREILTHIANGFSNKEIANMLNIGVRTVETHRERIMRKLDIHNVAGLTRYALRKGLITLD
jgi:DNA-binding NarL/FixJ family response regulator